MKIIKKWEIEECKSTLIVTSYCTLLPGKPPSMTEWLLEEESPH